ncbi:MAG: chemotaxis response regulator protein-glutamate methylesterase [Myxococcota bacterium]
MGERIRVLVVDDSALVRQILQKGLAGDPEIEVVGTAADPYIARDRIVELDPDVITLDVEMPRMNGVEFLRRLMPQHPKPVVMVSSLTRRGAQVTLDALAAGAVDFVAKPSSDVGRGLPTMMQELCEKVKAAARADVSTYRRRAPAATHLVEIPEAAANRLVAIGSSTGGTEALRVVLSRFPRTAPGMVVVQHMPAGFTARFAEQLDQHCPMDVKEAESGDVVEPGRVLLAPGDQHMVVRRARGVLSVELEASDRVSGHRPSVDVLFASVAKTVGDRAVGVILTGMGHDGADGLLAMRRAGARTIGQDEASCVVYGMPRSAFERGAVERQVGVDDVAKAIADVLGRGSK